jgi:proteasome alpha subunit
MSMQFYAPPEQVMKDRADYARKGIARGRALVATITASGVVLVAENPSRTLHKISEIYDRIAFAGVGRYSEYDQLRVAGVRHADTKGFAYAREDVDARSLANVYAQYLNQVFTHELKPLEVEILVAELGEPPAPSQLFQILYDGTVMDKDRFAVLGGDADRIAEQLERRYEPGWDLAVATRACVEALAGEGRTLEPSDLEVAVLAARNGRRAFARIEDDALAALLDGPPSHSEEAHSEDHSEGAQSEGAQSEGAQAEEPET